LLRANVAVALGTGLSRLTGFGRVAALAYALGQTRLTDAYSLANSTPNIVYELLLGGILTATLVPIFVRALDERDDDAVSAVVSVTTAVLVALTVVATLAAPLLVRLYTLSARGDDVDAFRAEATALARWFLPQILFYGITALFSALLNARRRFAAPAFAPVVNNLIVIAVLLIVPALASGDLTLEHARSDTAITVVLGLGTTLGIVATALVLIPAVRASGVHLRWRPEWRHPAVLRLVRLSGWTVGYVAANQVALLVVSILAARREGELSAYVMAFTFFQLPHGLLAVSVMTTFAPGLASMAGRGDLRAFRGRFGYGLRLLVFAVAPAAAGYLVLAHPLVSVLLERGAFGDASSERTAAVLVGFAFGLVGFSVYLYALRGFFALEDTRTPFLLNVMENGINIVIALAVVGDSGVEGLAWAYALAYTISAVVALRTLQARVGRLRRSVLASVLRSLVAAGVTALVVRVARDAVSGDVLQVVVGVPVGVATYLVVSAGLLALWRSAGAPPVRSAGR